MKVPRRSLITGSAALGALAVMRESAQADIKFTQFPFTATGAPTARTQPDRLAEIKNVLDFGADPTFATDSASAIQSAIDWTSNANRGTIFFPAGSYKIGSPLTFNAANLTICFRGVGQASTLFGTGFSGGNGFVLDRHLGSPSNTANIIIESLSFQNNATGALSGSVRVGSCNSVAVRDCSLQGQVGLTTEDVAGTSSQNILVENCSFSAGNGLIMGGSGAVLGNDWIGSDVGARMYGSGWVMAGNRLENCNTCYVIGLDTGTAATFTGSISGGVLTTSGVTGTIAIGQEVSDGGVNVPLGITINSSAGAGAWNLSNYPGVSVSSQAMTTIGNPAGASGFAIMSGTTEGNWTSIDLAGPCKGFYIGSVGMLGHPSTNAGVIKSIQATQYGIIVRANMSSYGVFQACEAAGNIAVAGGWVGTSTSRANLLFLNCDLEDTGGSGGVPFIPPTNAYTAHWQACNFSPEIWTWSQLPTIGGGNDQEGDEYNISDPNSNTWGQNVTGSGSSGHVLIRNNKTNYTVVAK